MKEYKRLTIKDEEYGNYVENKGSELNEPPIAVSFNGKIHGTAIDRLAELEDKIENGTLIELQDKEENLIGQQVYAIDICSYPKGKIITNFDEEEEEIIIGFTSNEIVTVNTTRGCNMYYKNGLWFLTKAEAKVKLKELKGEVWK